jgi:hypothetical protein
MLKVIQHALTIANFLSDHPAWLGIAIKMASIGEGDYHVVKKRALCCSRSVCFFVLPRASKIRPPARKKMEGNSGPDPLVKAQNTPQFNWYTCWTSLDANGTLDNLIKEGLKQPNRIKISFEKGAKEITGHVAPDQA